MALRLPAFSLSLSLPSSSSRRSTVAVAVATTNAITSSGGGGEQEMKKEVQLLLDQLSYLPPRGSLVGAMKLVKNRLTLPDFAVVFRELGRRGDWQRSLRLFRHMKRQRWGQPDELIHAIVISSISSDRQLLPSCLEVFDSLHPAHRTALSYTAIVSAFARHRDHRSALRLLNRMTDVDGVSPSVPVYNAALLACSSGDGAPAFDVLLGIFAEMRRHGLLPNLITYNILLSAAALRGIPDQAASLVLSMPAAGVSPDASSFSPVVAAFAKASRLDRARDLYRQLEDAGATPDAGCYNVLLEALAAAGDAAAAGDVLRGMQAAGCTPDASAYSLVMSVFGKHRRYEEAKELFLEMKRGGQGASTPDVGTYRTLIRVFGEGGLFREAATLFQDMLDEKIEPDLETYEQLFHACGMGGLHELAQKLLQHMAVKDIVPTTKCYDGAIAAYGNATCYEEALVALRTMRYNGVKWTIETYNTCLAMYAMGGLWKEAEEVLSMMENAKVEMDGDSYNSMIEVYCHSGRIEAAFEAFQNIRKMENYPRLRSLEAILEVHCTSGLADESSEQFLEIKSLGITPSIVNYCLLISVYAKTDRWDDVYELLDEMESNRSSNIHQVIASMIKGHYDNESKWLRVEYAFDNIISKGFRVGLQSFNALLEALWWLGQKARAERVLLEARKRGFYPELYRYSEIHHSVDVHRMSVGGALIAILSWLRDMQENFIKEPKYLRQIASVVMVRGARETKGKVQLFPVARAVYTFLKEHAPVFVCPRWNNGRLVCQRTSLRQLLSSLPSSQDSPAEHSWISIVNSPFPAPGMKLYTKLYTRVSDEGNNWPISDDDTESEVESEAKMEISMA